MFALFNAIYWTHVTMAAASGRTELAKKLGPGESELEWVYKSREKRFFYHKGQNKGKTQEWELKYKYLCISRWKWVTFCDFFIKNFDLIWQSDTVSEIAEMLGGFESLHRVAQQCRRSVVATGSYLHVTLPRIFFAHQEHALPGRQRHLISNTVS